MELSAEDRDTGENAQLTFSVVAGDQEQKFFMVSYRQEQRGTLRLKKPLDYERPSEQRFNLTLKVGDDGTHCPRTTFTHTPSLCLSVATFTCTQYLSSNPFLTGISAITQLRSSM